MGASPSTLSPSEGPLLAAGSFQSQPLFSCFGRGGGGYSNTAKVRNPRTFGVLASCRWRLSRRVGISPFHQIHRMAE